MTVGSQVKEALANAKSAQASFESFALQSQDERARQLYTSAAMQFKTIIQGLESRLQQIAGE